MKKIKNINLIISIIIMILMYKYIIEYNINNIEIQKRLTIEIIKGNYNLNFGIDGINLPFIIITILIFPFIFYTLESTEKNKTVEIEKKIIWILYIIIIWLFYILDIIGFYIMFEIILIPMFILIIKYGSRYNKFEASYRFIIYTIFGSILMLIGILLLYNNNILSLNLNNNNTINNIINYNTINNTLDNTINNNFKEINIGKTFNYEIIKEILKSENINKNLILLSFLLAFLIKIPLFPFHSWLPLAHGEANTRGSIILAALLLKLGTYGLIRYILEINNKVYYISNIILTLSILGFIYGCFLILRQIDLKRIIAYSSILHMNLVVLSVFTFDYTSLIGSYLTMIGHSFTSSSLFYIIGILYNKFHTRNLLYFRGLIHFYPILISLFFFFILSNISFPLTFNFIGEFLMLYGIFHYNYFICISLFICIVISTSYNLWFFNKISFGLPSSFLFSPLSSSSLLSSPISCTSNVSINNILNKYIDLNIQDTIILLSLLFFILFFGLFPKFWLNIPSLYFTQFFI